MIKIVFFIIILGVNISTSFAGLSNKNSKNLFFKTNQDIKVRLHTSDADIKTFNKTVKLIKKYKWTEALSWADSIKSENLKDAMVDYVLWKKYSSLSQSQAETEFDNLLNFIIEHQYLPNIKYLKIKAENMYVNKNIPYEFTKNYFEIIKPIQTKTAIRILKDKYALFSDKKNTNLTKEIVNVFKECEFNDYELSEFLEYFGSYLDENDYANKVEKLLWHKNYKFAKKIIPKLNTQNRVLYLGIIEINKNPKYINNILRSISRDLRENELLLYTRFVYEHKNNNKKNALKILLKIDEKTKEPEKWWYYQNYYARELITDKDYKKAYFLTINNNLKKETSEYSESQWLAGWIALTFLNKPKDAYYHFYNMYDSVSYPISRSRGAYWAGRAMEADENYKEAIKWYDIGAKYSLYFYGQLSYHAKNELMGIPSLSDKNPLPKPPSFTKEEELRALNNNIVKIAYLMAKSEDNRYYYTKLFEAAVNSAKTKGEISAIFEIIKNTENERLITGLAKKLTYRNVYFVDNLFPVLNIINLENPNSNLVHSIIKQESGFRVLAKSRVGATGFMQIMEKTAKWVCQKMNLRYSRRSLKKNPAYNILIGSYYINSLIKQFEGSQVLAIASYNAGPSAVNRWIREYGDPRKMQDIKSIVNWMELIGYSETRNYVQRIIEGSIVYEYILENSKEIKELNNNTTQISKKTDKKENEDNKKS